MPIPDGVSPREGAFVALGSIALQAVRRAEVQVGDTVAVLGLGLVGQLVSQLLQAAGARVIGTDVITKRLELAKSLGMEVGFQATEDATREIVRYTKGIGVDRVLLCAATSNNVVIEQAVKMARDRARVVVVGQCSLDAPRNEFYMKELDLVISRSYGPGRYDPRYEEQGIDYPIGYVRWTEQRNMQEFLRLLQCGKVDVKPLITHEFSLVEAQQGYDLLMKHPAECLAILLKYDQPAEPVQFTVPVRNPTLKPIAKSSASIGVVGCGAFPRQFHLPYLRKSERLRFHTLAASTAQSAKEMSLRYHAHRCTTDYGAMLRDPDIDAIMIFTRDTTHAPLAARAIEAGKHVFCEKPLATTVEDCELLRNVAGNSDRLCMTGFNRRFAPMMTPIKDLLDTCRGPKLLHYRVNAGPLPANSWMYDPAHSAGRIVGEACHFVDIFRWLIGCEPTRITATALGVPASATSLEDVSATLEFADGSVATLIYTASGSSGIGKERLEAFCEGTSVVMDDFRSLQIAGRKRVTMAHRRIDKGHSAELDHFADVLLGKAQPLIAIEDGLRATELCLAIVDFARNSDLRSPNDSRAD